jgi:hypothetical protein
MTSRPCSCTGRSHVRQHEVPLLEGSFRTRRPTSRTSATHTALLSARARVSRRVGVAILGFERQSPRRQIRLGIRRRRRQIGHATVARAVGRIKAGVRRGVSEGRPGGLRQLGEVGETVCATASDHRRGYTRVPGLIRERREGSGKAQALSGRAFVPLNLFAERILSSDVPGRRAQVNLYASAHYSEFATRQEPGGTDLCVPLSRFN